MIETDPTLRSMNLFNDSAHWDLIDRGIPIFVPHHVVDYKRDEQGKVTGEKDILVDEQRLRKIANRINALYQQKGVPIKFQEGHTRDTKKVPQKEQPDILAFGKNARVGLWGPEKLPGLLVDMYVQKGCLESVKKLPFRSAEFYDESDDLTAVALLKTDPRLDMGALIYEDLQANCVLYELDGYRWHYFGDKGMALPDDKTPAQVDDPTKPPALKEVETPKMFGDDMMGGEGEDAMPPPDYAKNFYACMTHYIKEKMPHLPEMCAKYAETLNAPAFPGDTNVQVPHSPEPVPKQDDANMDKKDDMSAHFARTQETLTKYEKSLADMGTKVSTLEKQNAELSLNLAKQTMMVTYGKELTKLKEGGYEFDYDAELEDALTMTRPQFDRHLARIQKYGKSPVTGTMINTAGPVGEPTFSDKHLEPTLQYMRENGLVGEDGWKQAMDHTLKNGVVIKK